MAAPEPMSFDDIPDPAAAVARRPAPGVVPPDEPSPTRGQRRLRLGLALLLAVAWVVALTLRFGVRGDIGSSGVLIELALWLGACVCAVAVALHPGSRGLSLGTRVLAAVLWGVPALFVATALGWSAASPHGDTWASIQKCLGLCAILGAVPMALTGLLFRRAFPVAAAWRLGLLGAVAGFIASIGCHAHCPIPSATHVIVAHGLSIALGAAAGAGWGALRGRA